MLGVPRVTCHNMPFQIFQGQGDDLLMVYPFAAANRVIHMADREELPVDTWMGKSMGTWDRDVLVVTTMWQNGPVVARSRGQPCQQPADRHRALHAARPEPHLVRSDAGRSDDLHPAVDDRDAQVRAVRRQAPLSGPAADRSLEAEHAPGTDGDGGGGDRAAGGADGASGRAPFVCRRVRLHPAGHARRPGRHDGVGEPALVGAHRREEARRLRRTLEDRGRPRRRCSSAWAGTAARCRSAPG
jgi:hypothetical protein